MKYLPMGSSFVSKTTHFGKRRAVSADACSLVLARSEARRLPDWGTFDTRENFMGKYFIAWLLGVPAVVLVVAYLFFH